MLVTFKVEKVKGPELFCHCRKCGPNAAAQSYLRLDTTSLYFIPVETQRRTFVECRGCGATWVVNAAPEELAGRSADDLLPLLRSGTSDLVKFFAVAGFLLSCAPCIGLTLSVVGLVGSWRNGGWPKTVSSVGVVLGVLTAVVSLVLTLTAEPRPQGVIQHDPRHPGIIPDRPR